VYTVNPSDIQRLSTYDPLLHFRWSNTRQCIVVEREANPNVLPINPGMIADLDERQSILNNRRLVTFIPPAEDTLKVPSLGLNLKHRHNGIDNVFWNWLFTSDVRARWGTADKLVDELIQQQLDTRQKRRLDFLDFVGVKARERARYMKTIKRTRGY
jgi:hypothetical protein